MQARERETPSKRGSISSEENRSITTQRPWALFVDHLPLIISGGGSGDGQ